MINTLRTGMFCTFAMLFVSVSATAQITPSKESLSNLYPGKAYSPYAQRDFPSQVYWGALGGAGDIVVDAGKHTGARPGKVLRHS